MTPEWSNRAGVVLQSPYWTAPNSTEEYRKRRDDEFYPLQEAIQASDEYDDLEEDMRVIFERAEVVALAKIKEDEDFAANDTGGWGRFLEQR